MKLKLFVSVFLLTYLTHAQSGKEISFQKLDERYKTDILLIVAHPDDETAIGSYLAQAIFDEGKKVSIIYTNRGEGGGNSVGNEQSTTMGLMREIEARKAGAKFGIENIWFLDGRDTPGQDVFASLQKMNHGAALEKVIRLMRLTRPEVVITWMPIYSAGENHGDHQASGVVATEAFDMAGDPAVFPTQIIFPREPKDINNIGEGLQPWQPKKLYFFSDREKGITATGPKFNISEISPSKKTSYVKITADLMTPHLTQADVSEDAIKAKASNDYGKLEKWLQKFHLLFGKSVVSCNPSGDVFEGISGRPLDFILVKRIEEPKNEGITLTLGGSFDYYKKFWRAHNLINFSNLVEPEVMVTAGSYFHIPLILKNNSNESIIISLKPTIPNDWKEYSGTGNYKLEPHQSIPVQTFLGAAQEVSDQPQEVMWSAEMNGKVIGTIKERVYLVEWNLPQ